MESVRVFIRPYHFKQHHFNQLPWAEGGYQIPQERADEPFMLELSRQDQDQPIHDLLLAAILENAIDEPEHVTMYHSSINGFRILLDARGTMLREGDEIKVLYDVDLPEYDY